MKNINAVSFRKTQEKKQERQENPEDLAYKADRCADILNHLLQNDIITNIKKDLSGLTYNSLRKNYEEVEVRKYLMAMLLEGANGARAVAISRAMIGKWNKAKLNDGFRILLVGDHKVVLGISSGRS